VPGVSALAALLALAAPIERRWRGIPAGDGVVQPGEQIVLALGMLAGEGATTDDALERLRHVQPGTAESLRKNCVRWARMG